MFIFGSWGFHAHRSINKHAVFLLPNPLQDFFIEHLSAIEEGAVRADKRRYIDPKEACKHYIDIDLYGEAPFDSLPQNWFLAKEKYTIDTLRERGILPWVISWQYKNLIWAMDSGTVQDVISTASDLGHYIGDACVPLHTTYNYNGQYSHQHGIHALWESRIPESFSVDYDYYLGKAVYLNHIKEYAWELVQESHQLVDSVLFLEAAITAAYPEDKKYRFEYKNGQSKTNYSKEFIEDYNSVLNGMVERRMQRAIFAISSLWYSAWIDAGQPDLFSLRAVEKLKERKEERIIPIRIHE